MPDPVEDLGQVKALTAEGRLSGVVLIALPIGLFLMMMYMKPDYIELLWKEPMGIKMSIGAVILMILGSICINVNDPSKAAAEIQRAGAHPQMVQVLVCGESQQLYGHRMF